MAKIQINWLLFIVVLWAYVPNALNNYNILKHQNDSHCSKCYQILESCSPLLSNWFKQVQEQDSTVHIMEAYRNEKKQNSMLKSGASRVGWGQSAHNYLPCLAIDLCFIIDGKSKQIPAKYKAMSKRLPETLENGSIFTGLVDWCHFQVKDWKLVAHNYPHGNTVQ